MYISDIKNSRKLYLGITIFCFVFQLIYEHFSHGVNSMFMICAFLIPLAGGILAELMLRSLKNRAVPQNLISWDLLFGAVIWLTLGSLIQGVLEIYGTTNQLTIAFLAVGALQLLLALVTQLKAGKK